MAAKKNKAKNLSINKGIDKWQRLNLPPEIIQLLQRRKGSSLHYVSITCTTKWWVPPASRCSRPRWPEFHHLGNSSNTSSASTRQHHFYGDYIIHNAATDSPQIMVYSSKDRAWVVYEFDPIDPYDTKKKCMEFTGIIGFLGEFYGVSFRRAVEVIQNMDSRLSLTGINVNKGAPSVNWRLFKEHLFEMNGELFLVFLIHKKSIEITDHVEVFRLCFDGLKWIKVEGLQGKTVILDERCSWVNSAEIGCRGDCIYFRQSQGEDNSWWIYDMQSSCISVASILEENV